MADVEQTTRIIRHLRSGQITIPSDVRKELGLDKHSLLQVTLANGELRIKPVKVAAQSQGSPWLKDLYDLFAPSREIAANYSEQEINDDIDKAIAEVRESHDPSRL